MSEHRYAYPKVVELREPPMPRLALLVDELLDAHCDTVFLAEGVAQEPAWAAHVRYLKDLQRVGQRTLAELTGARL